MKKIFIKYTGDKVMYFKGKKLGPKPIEINTYKRGEMKMNLVLEKLFKKTSASEQEISKLKSVEGVEILDSAKKKPEEPKAPEPALEDIGEALEKAVEEIAEEAIEIEPEAVVEEKVLLTEQEVKDMNKKELIIFLSERNVEFKKSMKVSELEKLVLENQ